MRQEASPRDIIFLARYTLHLLEVDQAYEKFDENKKHLHKKQTTLGDSGFFRLQGIKVL